MYGTQQWILSQLHQPSYAYSYMLAVPYHHVHNLDLGDKTLYNHLISDFGIGCHLANGGYFYCPKGIKNSRVINPIANSKHLISSFNAFASLSNSRHIDDTLGCCSIAVPPIYYSFPNPKFSPIACLLVFNFITYNEIIASNTFC